MTVRIENIRCVATAPAGIRLVVVKVETSDDGLCGLGCATFTQRPSAVIEAVEKYLKPFLRGRDVDEIEDIWQSAYVSSYWRQGPVLNNALSGVDMALWDIKGQRAGMPVYELLGGKCRMAASVYVHAAGREFSEVTETARQLISQGFRYIRVQVEVPGQATYGTKSDLQTHETIDSPTAPQNLFEPADYARLAPKLFEHARNELGDEVELLHDIHERLPASLAIQLARDLEPYRLFFLEDALPPEDINSFRRLRSASSIPIAMGELFTNVNEYLPLIREQLIDFVRVHLSDIGGLTPARKLAALCEFFGVRTAWHGPGDTSPIGHAANLALDLAVPNFGIQEFTRFNQATLDIFPGCPELRDGMLWPNDQPGWGVEIDEKLAKKFPYPDHPFNGAWPAIRRRDGSVIRP
ncbi:MAG: enolase C-terminal domain-like protein [Pirellulaceae bacterium]|jgi:mannonate dehydratase|nr:enolase C-terminal domain-like protein [Pirellulaceae bacterium]MDP7302598.1 enolase C-terminal domain-like protein [Pirellulaceae bacterium]